MNKDTRDDLLHSAGLVGFVLLMLLTYYGCSDVANHPTITGFGRAGVVR